MGSRHVILHDLPNVHIKSRTGSHARPPSALTEHSFASAKKCQRVTCTAVLSLHWNTTASCITDALLDVLHFYCTCTGGVLLMY